MDGAIGKYCFVAAMINIGLFAVKSMQQQLNDLACFRLEVNEQIQKLENSKKVAQNDERKVKKKERTQPFCEIGLLNESRNCDELR